MGAGGKVVILGVVGVFGGSCLLLELKEKLHLSECLSLRAEKGAAGMWPSILLIIIQNRSEHIAKSLSQTSTEHNTAANTFSPDMSWTLQRFSPGTTLPTILCYSTHISCCTTGHQVETFLLDTTSNPNTLRTS